MEEHLDEIKQFKEQIIGFLNDRQLDHSLLIGVNSQIQSKFSQWILSSFNVDYLNSLWTNIHYPILKYFQKLHFNHYELVNFEYKRLLYLHNTTDFRVKAVELRKLYDNYLRFSKQLQKFYLNLLKQFASFKNELLPENFLNYFEIKQDKQGDVSLLLIFKCCLSLGDIERNQKIIETQYYLPCLSNKNFFNYRNTQEKNKKAKPYFTKAFEYYQLCILLLPGLNDPYNHIGVIYNLLEDKFNALYYFVRSQFARVESKLNNLSALMKKHYFTTMLVDLDKFTESDKLNICLVNLIGYFYHPERYKCGKCIVKDITFKDIESKLIKNLHKLDDETMLKQLTILFGFSKLIENSKYKIFLLKYIERIDFKKLKSIRFLLNVFNENIDDKKVFIQKLIKMSNEFGIHEQPKRHYNFSEDVEFRDCSIIEFKDFDDDFDDINLIIGDCEKVDEDVLRKQAIGYTLNEILSRTDFAKLVNGKYVYDKELKKQVKTKKTEVKKKGLDEEFYSQIVPDEPIKVSTEVKSNDVVVPQSLEEIEEFISKQAEEVKNKLDLELKYLEESEPSHFDAAIEELPPRQNIWSTPQPAYPPQFMQQPPIPTPFAQQFHQYQPPFQPFNPFNQPSNQYPQYQHPFFPFMQQPQQPQQSPKQSDTNLH
ncbi:unnamed protein product [Candida verbasci]|uniref:Uncharacterized protein n=1 Tax=Candida verbasci TaxID=1227364 RepID=A0A9W4XBN8_9ASCO|nr:unnamed protein product [Candida verbasci]